MQLLLVTLAFLAASSNHRCMNWHPVWQLESPVQLRNGEEFNPDGQILICEIGAGECQLMFHKLPWSAALSSTLPGEEAPHSSDCSCQQLAVPLAVLQKLCHPEPSLYTSSSPCSQTVVKYTQKKYNSQPSGVTRIPIVVHQLSRALSSCKAETASPPSTTSSIQILLKHWASCCVRDLDSRM